MIPDGNPIAYGLLEPGTPIHAADGPRLGVVERVIENTKEHIFDGIVMRDDAEHQLWVDAPEVRRITDAAVTLSIAAHEVPAYITPYEPGAPEFRANPRVGRIGRFFGGGGWKRN